jgi:hypothetical protein
MKGRIVSNLNARTEPVGKKLKVNRESRDEGRLKYHQPSEEAREEIQNVLMGQACLGRTLPLF